MDTSKANTIDHVRLSDLRDQLFGLLDKFFRKYSNHSQLENIIKTSANDAEVLEKLAQLIPLEKSADLSQKEEIDTRRGTTRLLEVKKLLGKYVQHIQKLAHKQGSYLDLGSSDGTITKIVGLGMGFAKDHIQAADVVDYSANAENSGIAFTQIDGHTLPFQDNTFDFVTTFQVLHHMQFLDDMLGELVRVMKNDAVLVIREQDARFEDTDVLAVHKELFDLEHMLYDMVLNSPRQSYDDFWKGYYSNFHSMTGWHAQLAEYGFKNIKIAHINRLNPTNYYYALYILKK
jgi:SAM-dependent methyltransferase